MGNYQCKKCRKVVDSYFTPPTSGCPNSSHEWIDMGSSHMPFPLNRHFQKYICSKCKESLNSWGKPNKEGCPKGEHEWWDMWHYYSPGNSGGQRG